MSESNGNGFAIDELLNMVVPFDFPFEGHNLKGKWYKYKTTSPNYVKGMMEKLRIYREKVLTLTRDIGDPATGVDALAKLLQERDEAEECLQRTQYDWLADGLVEWNVVNRSGEALPISMDTLNSFPLLFLSKLNEFFANERQGQNPTLPTS